MKSSRHILIVSLIIGLSKFSIAQTADKPERPDRNTKDVSRGEFGKWLDSEGFIVPGPKTADFVDSDRDDIDDRFQMAPGKPAGKYRPDRDELKDKGQPDKPTIPGGDNTATDADKPDLNRPEKPTRPELSTELKGQLSKYKEENDALRSELKAELKKLKKPTREQIRQLTTQFQEDNKERLAKQKELADKIKSDLVKVRPTRPSRPEVSQEMTDAMAKLRKQHESLQRSVSDSQKELKAKLSSASRDEREALLDEFREDQKKLNDDIKNVQRKIREVLNSSLASNSATTTFREKRRPPLREDATKTGDRRTSDR